MSPSDRFRVTRSEQVQFGTADLVPDPKRPRGWMLLVDGVAQSYVDLDDPTHLEFEYVRRVASIIDACAPPGKPLRALHLGGGALCLPRYVGATRPGSTQVVIERDPALALLVHRQLPLPADSGIEIHIDDARTAIESARRKSYDLVILDAYEGAAMPRDLTSGEFVAHAARTLRPSGTYVVNITDLPVLAFSRVQAATVRGAFPELCVIAEPGMLRGRRFGNIVLAASPTSGTLRPDVLSRPRPGETSPVRVIHGDAVDEFIAGARPLQESQAGHLVAPPFDPSKT